MFRRSELFSNMSRFLTIALLILAMIFVLANSSTAQPPRIRIDTVMNQSLGQNTLVNIILEPATDTFVIKNYHLVIGYNSLLPHDVIPGDFVTSCPGAWWGWGTQTEPNTECSDGYCPEQLLHIYLSLSSDCYIVEPTVLCSIPFSLLGSVGEFYPLRFVWTDCGDNVAQVSDSGTVDTLLISRQVYDYDGSNISLDQPFFSHTGAPLSCYGFVGPDTLRLRGIDFQNGGIGVSYIDSMKTPRAAIYIEKTHNTQFGSTEAVSINLDQYPPETTDPLDIAAYDFLVAYDPGPLTFISADPGQLFQDCGWEYFEYHEDSAGFVRVVAVADLNNGDVHPSCLADSPGELAILNFQVTSDSSYHCQYSPIQFWWADCGDNSVSKTLGDTLFISNRVYEYDNWTPIANNQSFPSPYGAPTICVLDSAGGMGGVRAIDYTHGGVDIKCIDSIDSRGDVNLNDIAYEIADWVLFSNYFFYGLAVFNVNWEAQVAATDVNDDGLKLTLWDFVYLYRVIVGDALPFPDYKKAGVADTVLLVQDTVAGTITINYADSLSALILYFDSEIMMTTILPDHTVGGTDSLTTKVMVFPNLSVENPLPPIANGQVFEYTGSGNLIGALAAYNGLSFLQTAIEGGGVSTCCVIRGDIDHSGEIVQISDLVALVRYLFASGENFEPPCLEEANVDGLAGSVDLTDLIFLVDYMFNQGTAIPPCPAK